MTAKEMFEKLKWVKYLETDNELTYFYRDAFSIKTLTFNKVEKCYRFVTCHSDTNYGVTTVSLKLNKAIQQQIKELGWEE